MNKSDFYYDLPEELIAQSPAERRDCSRLLLLDRRTGAIEHKRFYDIADRLREGDCLVMNDTKVIPARIYGVKIRTGAKVEFLLLNCREEDLWECITGPGRRAHEGDEFDFSGEMTGTVEQVLENGNRVVRFRHDGRLLEVLDRIGEMPLPHYITKTPDDPSRYNTVYARDPGSAAAPTAGLHFTPELLEKIRAKGVKETFVTLNVGIGTFRPVKTERIEDHVMHREYYRISPEAAEVINSTKKAGGRIVSVGTTSCRTLESAADENGFVRPCGEWTGIFIYPGYEFRCVDALETNFHLPESTLIMLVSAFCGRENTLNAYKEAVKERYRFFSFGDAMFIS